MGYRTSLLLALVVGTMLTLDAQSKNWVDPTGASPRMTVVDTIHFETDTAVMVNGHMSLRCVAEAMKADATLRAIIEGFADHRGSDAHNLKLTAARAKAVAQYLEALGVPRERLKAVGMPKAERSGDAVTNFSNRKAAVILKRDQFEGPIVTDLPATRLPCDLPKADTNSATIQANGQVFQVTVDYAKIRQDFRAEIAAMLAEKDARRPAGGPESFDGPKSENLSRRPIPPAPVLAPTVDPGKEDYYRVSTLAESVHLAPPSGVKGEGMLGVIDAGWLTTVGTGALQTDMAGEVGAYRRRSQFDVVYSVLGGPVQASAFLGFVVVSGSPTASPVVLGNRQGLLFGGRLGLQWDQGSLGVVYANVSTPQAGVGQPAQEPLGCLGLDLSLGTPNFNVFLRPFMMLHPQQEVEAVAPALATKNGLDAEAYARLGEHVGLIFTAGSYPIYETYSAKNEMRFGLGVRISGGKASLAGRSAWVNVPTIREIFPF